MRYLGSLLLAILSLSLLALSAAPAPAQESVLPKPEQPFNGNIGRTVRDSTPDFPKGIESPAGAPNVLLIMTDDVGFGASQHFWRADSNAEFPPARRAAASATTCSIQPLSARPRRAALITGRNHHTVASGVITEMATGYPGYNSLVPKSCRFCRRSAETERLQHISGLAKCTTSPIGCRAQRGRLICGPPGLGL